MRTKADFVLCIFACSMILPGCQKKNNESALSNNIAVKIKSASTFDQLFFIKKKIKLRTEDSKGIAEITSLCILPDGNVLICDRVAKAVSIFDSLGNFVRSLGRRGQGPGELEKPVSATCDDDDHIYLLDNELLRVSKFSVNGEFLSSFSVPVGHRIAYIQSSLFVLDAANVVGDDLHIIHKYDTLGTNLISFGGPPEQLKKWGLVIIGGFLETDGRHLYKLHTAEYRGEKYSVDGGLERVFTRETSIYHPLERPLTYTPDDAEILKKWTPTGPILFLKPAILGLVIRTNHMSQSPPDRYFEIYDTAGSYLTGVKMPSEIIPLVSNHKSEIYFEQPASLDQKGNLNNPALIVYSLRI